LLWGSTFSCSRYSISLLEPSPTANCEPPKDPLETVLFLGGHRFFSTSPSSLPASVSFFSTSSLLLVRFISPEYISYQRALDSFKGRLDRPCRAPLLWQTTLSLSRSDDVSSLSDLPPVNFGRLFPPLLSSTSRGSLLFPQFRPKTGRLGPLLFEISHILP